GLSIRERGLQRFRKPRPWVRRPSARDGGEPVGNSHCAPAGDDGSLRIDSTCEGLGTRLVGEPEDVGEARKDLPPDRLHSWEHDRTAAVRQQREQRADDIREAVDELGPGVLWADEAQRDEDARGAEQRAPDAPQREEDIRKRLPGETYDRERDDDLHADVRK